LLFVWLSAISVVQLLDNTHSFGTGCLLNYNSAMLKTSVWGHGAL